MDLDGVCTSRSDMLLNLHLTITQMLPGYHAAQERKREREADQAESHPGDHQEPQAPPSAACLLCSHGAWQGGEGTMEHPRQRESQGSDLTFEDCLPLT